MAATLTQLMGSFRVTAKFSCDRLPGFLLKRCSSQTGERYGLTSLQPIATPTIKYEIGALLKDLMEWPSPPKSAYVIWELMAGNNPYGFDIR
ncbi:hypothetical protein GOBAR_AA31361 [Gossypium barbadense]|uniref:Uncharacterized protein n=1 Tax=Gossypium barbadense TaxID=3634 RepID=A0A2P5WE00_GOSBA|nr:hypothetical protein GOBAR_AA31361 [Gossypium barbadense]